MTNITFHAKDLGFIAQVAYSEIDRRRGPHRHMLRAIGDDFTRMALGQVPATWENVACWLEDPAHHDLDVAADILSLLEQAEAEAA